MAFRAGDVASKAGWVASKAREVEYRALGELELEIKNDVRTNRKATTAIIPGFLGMMLISL